MPAFCDEPRNPFRPSVNRRRNYLVTRHHRKSVQPPSRRFFFQFDSLKETGDFAFVLGHSTNPPFVLSPTSQINYNVYFDDMKMHLYANYTYMLNLSRGHKQVKTKPSNARLPFHGPGSHIYLSFIL